MLVKSTRWTLLVGVLLCGCVSPQSLSVDYDERSNRTRYTSTDLAILEAGSSAIGLQGERRVSLHAEAVCGGAECMPGEVDLVFVRESASESWIDTRTLALDVDGTIFEWSDQSRQETVRVLPGEFIRIPLNLQEFGRFATARRVRGTLGGMPFRLDYDDRAPFRAMLARFGNAGEG